MNKKNHSLNRLMTLSLLLIFFVTLSCTNKNGKSLTKETEEPCNTSFPKSVYTEKERLQKITGVVFPDYIIIDYNKGEMSFHGDYTDEVTIEFKATPSNDFYQIIDSLISIPHSGWSKTEQHYSYSRMWGNGLPAPEGENDEEDMSLSISFDKGSKQAILTFGTW